MGGDLPTYGRGRLDGGADRIATSGNMFLKTQISKCELRQLVTDGRVQLGAEGHHKENDDPATLGNDGTHFWGQILLGH